MESHSSTMERWKERAHNLRREIGALYLAVRDPRTPWYAKLLGLAIVGYALSPLDLIPDPIPVLGYLDDLILLPLAILLVRRLIPPDVLADARQRALDTTATGRARWLGATLVILAWAALLLAALYLLL
jgi:uncharacterized membrane protein YkvA (DUF1232 family)